MLANSEKFWSVLTVKQRCKNARVVAVEMGSNLLICILEFSGPQRAKVRDAYSPNLI